MRPALAAILASGVHGLACLAQPTPPTGADPRLPPPVRLGVRLELLRRQWPSIPCLVLVEDESSFVDAIAGWRLAGPNPGRFPVLFDDGSVESARRIAAFSRAFSPSRVVRWVGPRAGAIDLAERAARVEEALGSAWGFDPADFAAARDARWRELRWVPPGIVAAELDDPAWASAGALAIARGELLAWIPIPGRPNDSMSVGDARALESAIEDAAQSSGRSWRELGDDLDVVTIVGRAPARADSPGKPDEHLALSDVLGRVEGDRWAWAGHVLADASGPRAQASSRSLAAHRVMASIFLAPDRAWLFDGYTDEKPWSIADATRAGELWRASGLEAEVLDAPRQGLDDWRRRAGAPVDAGLVLVNSSGERSWFNLNPGVARAGDVPALARPAIVHMIHSWSAVRPADRATIAARWLERGAFAYVGAVEEPYLQAFVPTPLLAERLAKHYPLGAAARTDDSPAWRVAVLGDPLITIGPPAPRSAAPLPLEGATPIEPGDDAAPLATRVRALVITGRSAEAIALGRGSIDRGEAVDPEAALLLLDAAFHALDRGMLLDAFERIPREEMDDHAIDLVWLAAGPELVAGSLAERELGLLEANLREDQRASDAISLAPSIARVRGASAARGFLARAREGVKNPKQRREIDEAIARYGG